jgi:hypothetical protein
MTAEGEAGKHSGSTFAGDLERAPALRFNSRNLFRMCATAQSVRLTLSTILEGGIRRS